MTLFDRDYDQTFEIEMKWHEWNKIWCLMAQGIDKKEEDDWSDEEIEADRKLRDEFNLAISKNSPGNGMDDWPEDMKKAYDKAVVEILEEME